MSPAARRMCRSCECGPRSFRRILRLISLSRYVHERHRQLVLAEHFSLKPAHIGGRDAQVVYSDAKERSDVKE